MFLQSHVTLVESFPDSLHYCLSLEHFLWISPIGHTPLNHWRWENEKRSEMKNLGEL